MGNTLSDESSPELTEGDTADQTVSEESSSEPEKTQNLEAEKPKRMHPGVVVSASKAYKTLFTKMRGERTVDTTRCCLVRMCLPHSVSVLSRRQHDV